MSGADLLSVYKLIVLVQLARGDTRYMPRASIARTLMCILFCATAVVAQQISGSIIGVVKDSQMASIVGAKVTLSDQAQGTSREATTATDGSFVFTLVQPGSYNLTVESPGFKKFEQKDVKVFANRERDIAEGDAVVREHFDIFLFELLETGRLHREVVASGLYECKNEGAIRRSGRLAGGPLRLIGKSDFGADDRSLLAILHHADK